jgi:tellurite resistance protein TehA-like permease
LGHPFEERSFTPVSLVNTLALISNILSGDGLIIFLVLLLLFGSRRLPELAKGLSRAVGLEVPDERIRLKAMALLRLFFLRLLILPGAPP